MAAREILESVVGRVQLNIGSTTTGSVRTKNLGIGTLDKNAWDPDKFLAIVGALSPILTYSVYDSQAVKTYQVTQ